MFWINVEAILTNIQNDSTTSKTYILLGYKNKTKHFLHRILLIKDSLEQQIHLNGNTLGTNAVVVTRVRCIILKIKRNAG